MYEDSSKSQVKGKSSNHVYGLVRIQIHTSIPILISKQKLIKLNKFDLQELRITFKLIQNPFRIKWSLIRVEITFSYRNSTTQASEKTGECVSQVIPYENGKHFWELFNALFGQIETQIITWNIPAVKTLSTDKIRR